MSSLILPGQSDPSPVRVDLAAEPEIAPDVLAGLREVDPSLTIRWHPLMKCWMLLAAWDDNDPRRARVRAQELAPSEAVDLLDYLPAAASVEEAYSHVINTFRRISSRSDAQDMAARLVERVHHFNKAHQREQAMEAFGNNLMNYAEVMPTEAAPKIGFVGGVSPEASKAKAKAKAKASTPPT
jgi:hypothetical protein